MRLPDWCLTCGGDPTEGTPCDDDAIHGDGSPEDDAFIGFEASLWRATAPPVRDTLTGMAGR